MSRTSKKSKKSKMSKMSAMSTMCTMSKNSTMSKKSTMRRIAIAWAALLLGVPAAGAQEKPMHAGALAHALDRLGNTGRVLYVAAHPDDENTRLLAYLTHHRHVTTAYLSLTRGSGGQNLIGAEQGDLLGVIRTEELLAARRLDASRQFFTRARDFGYSKSAAETLAVWGHDEVLADVVWVIRSFQPDVIITRFDENPPNHGHHTASATLAREAFAAAADPLRFPEQLARGVSTWQTERLFHNLSTWRPVTIPDDALALDVGGYDPRLGLGYGELAAASRTQHKSQGFGRAGERGPLSEHLVLLAGSRPEHDLLDELELTWARFGAPARPLVAALVAARASLDRDEPEKSIPALLAARTALADLPDDVRVRDARADVDALIMACMGLFARANAAQPAAAPGTTFQLDIEVVARRPSTARLRGFTPPHSLREALDEPLTPERRIEIQREVHLPADLAPTPPFWLARTPEPGLYRIDEANLRAAPRAPSPLSVEVELTVDEHEILLRVPVVHAWNDRIHGERTRRFLIQPPATVTPLRDAILSVNGEPAPLTLRVRAGRSDFTGNLRVAVPDGWSVLPASVPIALSRIGDETVVEVSVRAPAGRASATLEPQIVVGDDVWAYREDVIDYEHVPVQQVLRPARVRAATVNLDRESVGSRTIGYIDGSGDSVAGDLAHVGLRVERIDDATLLSGDLKRFSALVLGIRAYNSRPAVRRAHQRLMDYVEAGGTLVTQYNTHSQWDPLAGPIGPFPLEIGRGRVTDETATVTGIDPQHPILRAPNPISEADFAGWVQERGLYFAESWDERYTPILAMADPDEEPQEGALLVATHGRGRFVYTGLAFFRQLPAGVPGAYRLFANLLIPAPADAL